jgi:hypothetical protein
MIDDGRLERVQLSARRVGIVYESLEKLIASRAAR